MEILLYIILATLAVSLISFIGILVLFFSEKILEKILLILVSLASGGLLGGAFFHLIPESVHEFGDDKLLNLFGFVLFGFVLFLLIEQLLHWHHYHHIHGSIKEQEKCIKKKPVAYLILVADGVHNFIDGLIIAAAFVVNPVVGVITTIAVALHEIPQEIGDFGILVYGGFKKVKALIFNFISASTIIVGGIVGFLVAESVEGVMVYLLPIAAGGFIYIAASDLVPEIKHGKKGARMVINFLVFLLGIAMMYILRMLPFGGH